MFGLTFLTTLRKTLQTMCKQVVVILGRSSGTRNAISTPLPKKTWY